MTFTKPKMILNISHVACEINQTDHEMPLDFITGNNIKI